MSAMTYIGARVGKYATLWFQTEILCAVGSEEPGYAASLFKELSLEDQQTFLSTVLECVFFAKRNMSSIPLSTLDSINDLQRAAATEIAEIAKDTA